MAQERQPRGGPGFTENAENANPASPVVASLLPPPCNTSGRNVQNRSYLEELDAAVLNNAQNLNLNLTRHSSSRVSETSSSSILPRQGEPPATSATSATALDSPIQDQAERYIGGDVVVVDPNQEAPDNRREAHSCLTQHTPTTRCGRKASSRTKHAHFAPFDSFYTGDTTDSSLTEHVKYESFSDLLAQPDIQQIIGRHDAKRFDCILSLPRDAGDLVQSKHLRRICADANITRDSQKVYFGCNLLYQRTRTNGSVVDANRSTDNYTLIATPLGHRQYYTDVGVCKDAMLSTLQPPGVADTPLCHAEIASPDLSNGSPIALGASLGSAHSTRAPSIPRSPASSVARIEDTIEELDKLEDEFEAVTSIVRVGRVLSPDKEPQDADADVDAAPGKRLGSLSKSPRGAPGALRAAKQLQSQPSPTYHAYNRRPAQAPAPAKDPSKSTANRASMPPTGASPATAGATAGAKSKRLSVARPLSLLPPKPPAKSTKPPTRPDFELPGEAVARRLKEQREARLAAAAAAAAAPPNTPDSPNMPRLGGIMNGQLRRVKSMKRPTIPNFELPGEAISRRKREEHEEKIRRQVEEERKRREFKATPIRLSVTPSTVPRENIASRARQSAVTGGGLSVPGSGPPTSKRHSLGPGEAANRDGGNNHNQTSTSRGRRVTLGPSPLVAGETNNRALSTSTGSISGLRSTISAEDVQRQRLRGKTIVQRDNTLSSDRDREKRAREALAKQARQEAAERSRQRSREWAEKQKQKARLSLPTS